MSTKCSIAWDNNFHFYHECFDDDHVYLELETTNFEAGYGKVMMPIPIHIWETIRHLGEARLDLVDKTDEELQMIVETEVDKRIKDCAERPDCSIMKSFGCMAYGLADEPREDQIKQGIEYFTRERTRQQEIFKKIKVLKEKCRLK